MPATRALLVHSPLVGPATVRPLGSALERRGWAVVAPDLRNATTSPDDFARDAAAGGRCGVVIGHSGAGAVLAVVAERVGAAATVFVDAVVPDAVNVFRPSATFLRFVDTIPVEDGRLAPWHEWWPAGTVERLVPDDAVRAAIIEEIPRVPRAFYDAEVALPPQWWTAPMAYLQLSPAYDDDRARAERWHWPCARIDGDHLMPATRPSEVADMVGRLVAILTE